ncbi:MAG TPA: hypothetical protein VGF40_15925 [Thermoanaerobaculia bacterium]
MTGGIATKDLRRTGWRALAALVAMVAIVSLVHWHPLFEDSSSETLRDAANQCAACITGPSAPPVTLAASPYLVPVASAVAVPATAAPPAPVVRAAPPRAPPV